MGLWLRALMVKKVIYSCCDSVMHLCTLCNRCTINVYMMMMMMKQYHSMFLFLFFYMEEKVMCKSCQCIADCKTKVSKVKVYTDRRLKEQVKQFRYPNSLSYKNGYCEREIRSRKLNRNEVLTGKMNLNIKKYIVERLAMQKCS